MYKLRNIGESYWLEAPFGIRLQIRAFCTSIVSQVQNRIIREVRSMRDEFLELEKVGKKSPLMVDFNNESEVEDLINNLVMKAYSCSSIVAWEGVEHETKDGVPAECTPENIARLVEEPKIGQFLWTHIKKDLSELFSEGKSLSLAPNGTLEMGLGTVNHVENKT
jgi:hypothetical protein